MVLLNAGVGIYLGRDDISMEDSVKLAAEIIDSGKAYEKLEAFVKATQA